MITICATCEHVRNTRENAAYLDVWYNFRCACPDEELIQYQDRVTGIMEPRDVRPFCRDINDGNCQSYSTADPSATAV